MTSSIKLSSDLCMEEEDEDLFEIDLEAVNCIPPPHYWDRHYISTENNALLANCLMPISDISNAVPACNNAVCFEGKTKVLFTREPMSLGEYLRLPFLGAIEILEEKMKAQFNFQFQH
ncbi:hypothetical protein TanjilG_28577 [Lupinus angustifolius]|uniref:Uncharacterized protein n=1 Tax=Lupinus angustifolius TaxID=3871 RepID=A0A4P1RJG0_LUPAN|nr:PREDICTED: uncharacterized protein LOC109347147 [Lupinus angustifolius]OIW12169.1 hypothetical protein TanjilG_28577 [Lupinus angustifolius]